MKQTIAMLLCLLGMHAIARADENATLRIQTEKTLRPWDRFSPWAPPPGVTPEGTIKFSLSAVETGKKVSLTPEFEQIAPEVDEASPPPCVVASGTIQGGGHAKVDCTLSGPFEIGKTDVQIRVTAPTLKDATELKIHVERRIAGAWFLLVILGGLAVGFFVRTWLTTAMKRDEQRAAAWTVVETIEAKRDEQPDEAFREAARKLREALEKKIAEADRFVQVLREVLLGPSNAWKEAADEATAALKTAVDALGERREAARKSIDDLRALVAGPFELPAPLAASFAARSIALGEAQTHLQAGRVGEAQKKSDESRAAIDEAVKQAARALPDALKASLDALRNAPSLPAEPATLAAATADDIRAAVEELKKLGTDPTVDTKARVEHISAAMVAVHLVVVQLRWRLHDLANAVAGALAPTVPAEKTDALCRAARAALDDLARGPWDDALARAPAALTAFSTALATGLEALAPAAPVRAATAARAYLTAAAEVVKSLTANRLLGPAPPPPAFVPAAPSPTPPARPSAPILVETTLSPLEFARAQVRRYQAQALWARLVQSLFHAVIALAIALRLTDSLYGTPADLIAVFAAAFVLDLTGDTMTTLVKKLAGSVTFG